MAHLDDGGLKSGVVTGIAVQTGEFGFCSRGHHIFEDTTHSMEMAPLLGGKHGRWFGGIKWFNAEEEVAADAAVGFCL